MSSRRGSSSSLGSSNSSSSSFEFLESEDDDLVVLPDVLSDDADTDGGVAVNVEARASAGAFPSDHHDEDAQAVEDFTADWILGSTSYYAGAPAPPSPVSPTGTRISHTDMLHVNHNGSTANAVRDDSHSAGARAEAGTQGHQPTAAAAAASAAVSVAVATASAQAGAEMPEGMGCSGGAVAAGQGSSELLAAMAVLEQERDALAARLLDTDYALSASEGALRSLTAQHASTRALLDELAAHALLAPAPAPPAPKPLPATQQAAAPHAHCTPATAPGAATLAAAAGIAAAVVANPARAAGESEGLLRANGPEPHGVTHATGGNSAMSPSEPPSPPAASMPAMDGVQDGEAPPLAALLLLGLFGMAWLVGTLAPGQASMPPAARVVAPVASPVALLHAHTQQPGRWQPQPQLQCEEQEPREVGGQCAAALAPLPCMPGSVCSGSAATTRGPKGQEATTALSLPTSLGLYARASSGADSSFRTNSVALPQLGSSPVQIPEAGGLVQAPTPDAPALLTSLGSVACRHEVAAAATMAGGSWAGGQLGVSRGPHGGLLPWALQPEAWLEGLGVWAPTGSGLVSHGSGGSGTSSWGGADAPPGHGQGRGIPVPCWPWLHLRQPGSRAARRALLSPGRHGRGPAPILALHARVAVALLGSHALVLATEDTELKGHQLQAAAHQSGRVRPDAKVLDSRALVAVDCSSRALVAVDHSHHAVALAHVRLKPVPQSPTSSSCAWVRQVPLVASQPASSMTHKCGLGAAGKCAPGAASKHALPRVAGLHGAPDVAGKDAAGVNSRAAQGDAAPTPYNPPDSVPSAPAAPAAPAQGSSPPAASSTAHHSRQVQADARQARQATPSSKRPRLATTAKSTGRPAKKTAHKKPAKRAARSKAKAQRQMGKLGRGRGGRKQHKRK